MEDKTIRTMLWISGLVLIAMISCATIVHLNSNPYELAFNMDNNTNDVLIKAIEVSDYPFGCNTYAIQYFECDKSTLFMNATGIYCDDRLFCENEE